MLRLQVMQDYVDYVWVCYIAPITTVLNYVFSSTRLSVKIALISLLIMTSA